MSTKLQVLERKAGKKSETKKLRRDGSIPAVMYVRGKESKSLTINRQDFEALLRKIEPRRLATTVLNLELEDGKKQRALIKEIQYHKVTYKPIHLDFEELAENTPISVNIPIECVGAIDCVGIKAGGLMRQVIRHVRVSCLPKDMPTVFELDIRNMNINDAKRLLDLEIPAGVKVLAKMDVVIVAIVKK